MSSTTKQTVSIELDVPACYRVELRPPRQGEKWMDAHGNIFTASCDGITPRFVLVPIITAPQWLVESDYTSIEWRGRNWYFCINGEPMALCFPHHDLRDMLAKIDPTKTPVAWVRGK